MSNTQTRHSVGDDVEVRAFGAYRTGTVLELSPTGKRVRVRHWMPGNGPLRVAWFPADRVWPDSTIKRDRGQ